MATIDKSLATLPRHIVKSSKNYYYNSKTGRYIHVSKLHEHLPKPALNHEQVIDKRWDLKQER